MEVFGTITALIYIFLEIRQNRWMWIVNIISASVYAWVFYTSHVYANMGLQVYYIIMSIYGLSIWQSSRMDGNPEKIIYRDIRTSGEFIGLVGLLSICWAALYFILSRYTDGAQSLLDSFTAAVGVIATWMTARRFIESWLLWIAVNIASVCLYYNTELYFTMSLYLCYVVLSVVGYLRWKKRGIRE